MSLVGTLGKMAVGMIVAKGMKGMLGGTQNNSGGGLLGGLIGNLAGGQNSGGLGDLLGSLTGSSGQTNASVNQQGGGLADLIQGMQGDPATGRGKGAGFSDLMDSLTGGVSSGSGGIADLVGMLGGAGGQAGASLGGILDSLGSAGGASTGLGGLLNSMMQGNPTTSPNTDQEHQAEVMLQAMISAAKSDGEIDAQEQQKIADHLDDVTADELAMVQRMMSEPNDMQALISNVPAGMEQQIYFISLLGIDLDSQSEAQYLHALAQGLGLSEQVCNAIHDKLGAPTLYS